MIDFNKLIDNYFSRKSNPKTMGRYYPSEIGGCMRKTWFSYKFPKEIKKDTIRIFEAGNMIHEFISEVLKSDKNPEVEIIEQEVAFKLKHKDFIISGRIDDLLLIKINNKQVLLEVKSSKFLPNEINESHKLQLQLYMHATNIPEGIVLYVQKDNLQTKWFNEHYNAKIAENILSRFENLHNSLIEDKIPEPEAKINESKAWICKYCDYEKECDKLV